MLDWKSREIFSRLSIPVDIPVIVRVDGWRFRKLAEELELERPYDERLLRSLIDASKELMERNLPVALAYVFSDEISLLFAPPLPWNGRVEKIVSIVSSFISARTSLALGYAASFDGRIVLIRDEDELVSYLSWRQDEAWRNALNSYALLALEKEGLSREKAAEELHGKKSEYLHELIFKKLGVNIAKVPAWQRRGVLVRKAVRIKDMEHGPVERREIVVDWELPLFSSPEGLEYIKRMLETVPVFRRDGSLQGR